MMTSKNNRVRNLSTRWLSQTRFTLYTIYVSMLLAFFLLTIRDAQNGVVWWDWLMRLAVVASFTFGLTKVFKMISRLKRVEFDNRFLYVINSHTDIVIPLENIKSVEIESLDGVYKVTFYHNEVFGDYLYFKLSLLYPLNYKSKDALVNVMRSYIDKAKAIPEKLPVNALHS